MTRRALHFVLKIGSRKKTIPFLRDLLGMKVLRHEEFQDKCPVRCNGPYDGKWSRTMIGYGPEISNFVLELGYTYGGKTYKLGNDLVSIQISSKLAYENIVNKEKNKNYPFTHKSSDTVLLKSPDGYPFEVRNTDIAGKPSISKVELLSSNLKTSKYYWHDLLKIKSYKTADEEAGKSLSLAYNDKDAKLDLISLNGQPVHHEQAFGRIAFACPEAELKPLQDLMIEKKQKILNKLISLETPGKATVQVIILADPDGHEICFVGEKAFDQLSEVDPKANELLQKAMTEDKSDK